MPGWGWWLVAGGLGGAAASGVIVGGVFALESVLALENPLVPAFWGAVIGGSYGAVCGLVVAVPTWIVITVLRARGRPTERASRVVPAVLTLIAAGAVTGWLASWVRNEMTLGVVSVFVIPTVGTALAAYWLGGWVWRRQQGRRLLDPKAGVGDF